MYIIDADAHPPIEAMDIDFIGSVNPQTFFERIARTGANAVWGVPAIPEGVIPPDCARLMELAAETVSFAQLSGGRYIPAIWVHPAQHHFCRGLVTEYSLKGVRMCGDIQREWLDEDSFGLHVLLDVANRHHMAVCFNGGTPEQLARIAECYPTLEMIVRGLGIMPAIDLMAKYPNIYLITTGINNGNYLLHNLLEKLPADRVMYGSGYPFCNPGYQKGSIDWELRDTSDEVRAAVMGQNAKRVSTPKHKGGSKA